jgi:Spy/CpxP family protein refolding chaperone
LVRVARRGGFGRRGRGYDGWQGASFNDGGYAQGGGGGFFNGGSRFEGFVLRRVFQQLDATPGQEKVIAAALDELRESTRSARGELQTFRADVARSVQGEVFDEGAIDLAYSRQDELIATVRKAAMGAIAKVHEVLDEKQRARLAQLIAEGPSAAPSRPSWQGTAERAADAVAV